MGSSRLRFTTRSLMLVVLLVGLNLAAALATSSYYPRRQLMFEAARNLSAPYIGFSDEHGLTYTYRARGSDRPAWRMSDPGRGWRMCELRRDPVPPTLMQIWSPIMASVSISLLILLVPFGPVAPGRRRTPINPDRGGGSERWTRRLIAARVIAVALALILLNITGAVSGPRPGCSYIPLDDREFFGGTPRMLVIRMEGTTVQTRRLDATDWLGRLASLSGTADERYDFEEGTIEYRRDASIVTYAGTPERKLSPPHMISPPARSFLDLWWPLMCTLSVTVVVILCLMRLGLSDARISSISGQESKRSLEVHQHLPLNAVEDADQEAIRDIGL